MKLIKLKKILRSQWMIVFLLLSLVVFSNFASIDASEVFPIDMLERGMINPPAHIWILVLHYVFLIVMTMIYFAMFWIVVYSLYFILLLIEKYRAKK